MNTLYTRPPSISASRKVPMARELLLLSPTELIAAVVASFNVVFIFETRVCTTSGNVFTEDDGAGCCCC